MRSGGRKLKEKNEKTDAVIEERLANTARVTEKLKADGYEAEDATVSILKANLLSLVTALPFAALFIVLFLVQCSPQIIVAEMTHSGRIFWLLGLVLLSIPVHEGLHGLGWMFSCERGWKSIQFGVMWSQLTPYCHCREALSIKRYAAGLLLPFFVLGVLPCIFADFVCSPFWLLFGAFNLLLAGGDTTIACILLKYSGRSVKILDHPTKCGAVVFVRQSSLFAVDEARIETL